MIKKIFDTIVFLCVSPIVLAQVNIVKHISFLPEQFRYRVEDDMLFIESDVQNLFYSGDTLASANPFVYSSIQLDSIDNFETIDVSCSDSILFYDIQVKCNSPQSNTLGNKNVFSFDNKHDCPTYKYLKSSCVEMTGIHCANGRYFVGLRIYPFDYDQTKHTLALHKDIKINIIQKVKQTEHDQSLYSEIKTTVAPIPYDTETNRRYLPSTQCTDYEYLIVTKMSLVNPFVRLADWKTLKGVKTHVLTIEEINNNYSGNTIQMKIKQAIKDYYDGQHIGLKYVLLAGNNSDIPSLQCFIKYFGTEDYTPTDLFYGCLDTMDWDTNGNGKYGEIDDSVDIAPDVTVSRIPVGTLSEANAIVDRIIKYEKTPTINNWKEDILMCGNVITNVTHTNPPHSDAENFGEVTFNNYIHPYWTTAQRTRFYDTFTDFPEGSDYTFSAENLQIELAKGYKVVFIDTHGIDDSYQMEIDDYDHRYTTSYADSLVNIGNSSIITTACHTNAFDHTLCLSRSLMLNENSGLMHYIGSSSKNWFPQIENYYRTLFSIFLNSNEKQLAVSFKDLKTSMVSSADSYNYTGRWLLYVLNILGDPEASSFLAEPQEFVNVHLSFSNGSLSVNTGIDGCRVCVMGDSDLHNDYYSVVRDTNCCIFENIGNKGTICITKPGYIPYIAAYIENAHVQNRMIQEGWNIVSDNISLGSNVIDTVPQGPVVIKNGKTTIFSKNVLIKNNFEVKKGASMKITP